MCVYLYMYIFVMYLYIFIHTQSHVYLYTHYTHTLINVYIILYKCVVIHTYIVFVWCSLYVAPTEHRRDFSEIFPLKPSVR